MVKFTADIFKIIKNSNAQIYLRPRKNLTKNVYYDQLDPVILDCDQPFDIQLNRLQPDIVIAFKSTALKVSASYGFTSIALFNLLDITDKNKRQIEDIFWDSDQLNILSMCKLEQEVSFREAQ